MSEHTALTNDLYQLTMAQAYMQNGMHLSRASFELRPPKRLQQAPGWGWLALVRAIGAGICDLEMCGF